jgi:hypothetical protein
MEERCAMKSESTDPFRKDMELRAARLGDFVLTCFLFFLLMKFVFLDWIRWVSPFGLGAQEREAAARALDGFTGGPRPVANQPAESVLPSWVAAKWPETEWIDFDGVTHIGPRPPEPKKRELTPQELERLKPRSAPLPPEWELEGKPKP